MRLPFSISCVRFCASDKTGFERADVAPAIDVAATPPVAKIAAAPNKNCAEPIKSLLVSVAVLTLTTRERLPGFNFEKGFNSELETILRGIVLSDAH